MYGYNYSSPNGAAVVGGYVPGVGNLSKYQVNWNQWEAIKQSLTDTAVYPTTGVNQLSFFATPQGQGVSAYNAGIAKTTTDTNMTLAGQLPANQMFLVQSFEVEFLPGLSPSLAGLGETANTATNDSWIFRKGGTFTFFVGSKNYLQEAPLLRFPAKADFAVQAALADTTTAGASHVSQISYGKAVGRPYILTPNNILLIANQNFGVTLTWPEGLAVITSAATVRVIADGFLYRRVQ